MGKAISCNFASRESCVIELGLPVGLPSCKEILNTARTHVGLKRILGVKRRSQILQIMNELQHLGFISYSLDRSTKKLRYEIADWIRKENGE